MDILVYIIIILVAGGASYGAYKLWERRERGHWGTLLGTTLFLVQVPKEKKDQKPSQQEEKIGQAEQLYAAFSDLKIGSWWHRFLYGRPRVVVEVSNVTEQKETAFYVAAPKGKEEELKSKIQGTYPDAQVEKMDDDYNIFQPQGKESGVYLQLNGENFFPIKTYHDLKMDPLSQITNALSKLSRAEGAAYQIVLRPVMKSWTDNVKSYISKLEKGKPLREAQREASFSASLADELKKIIMPGSSSSEPSEPEQEKTTIDQETIEALRQKTSQPNFEVNIRILASADSQKRANQIIDQISGSFGQFSSAVNGFEPVKVGKRHLSGMISDFSFRRFSSKEKMILNSSELASLCHLSLEQLKTPGLKGLKSSRPAPPSEIPTEGDVLLGRTVYRDEKKKVHFASRKDRRRHFYLVGQTGVGKTAFMQELARQDIEGGEGVGIIDPHGDFIEDILAVIPKERVEDVVLFEPFYKKRPCGLNMLEYETSEQKDFAVQEMISIFHKLFPPEIIGPMFEHYMRNAMLALMADKENPGTLTEIPRMFTDDEFRKKTLAKVEDPPVKNFWKKEWGQTTGQTRSDMVGYVVSKLGRFVENEMMRNIIGQKHSSFNLADIMDEGKIFLANLSKGKTGEVNASLLGLILVTKLQMAAMRRADIPQSERKDFYLYMDEFQNFTTDSIATILSEARKYRLNLTIAHQYISQLDEEIRDAVFGNVGTLGVMRVGAEDAEILETQFEPRFTKKDIANLPNYDAILRLIINGHVAEPFRMRTLPPKEGHPEIVDSIKEFSRLKYGRKKEEVEKKTASEEILHSDGEAK